MSESVAPWWIYARDITLILIVSAGLILAYRRTKALEARNIQENYQRCVELAGNSYVSVRVGGITSLADMVSNEDYGSRIKALFLAKAAYPPRHPNKPDTDYRSPDLIEIVKTILDRDWFSDASMPAKDTIVRVVQMNPKIFPDEPETS